jgi:hypothetical protein
MRHVRAAVIGLVCLATLFSPPRLSAQRATVRTQPHAVAVKLTSDTAMPYGARARAVEGVPGWFVVEHDGLDSDQLAAELAGAEHVEPLYVAAIAATTNDPLLPQQYSLNRMQAPSAWDVSHGAGVTIAIVDTGVDCDHPDLAGQCVSRGRNFVTGGDGLDDQGHGTHVAGIAGARGNNGLGIAGVAYEAKILPVKVLTASGQGHFGHIAEGMVWACQQPGVRVVNMSLGCRGCVSQLIDEAAQQCLARGVLPVAAAGNDNTNEPSYPAASPYVVGVAATDQNDAKAGFSNWGRNVEVSAPGVAVLSTVRGSGYQAWNGTSMASPNAAGVAALVLAARPGLTPHQVRGVLASSADPIGPAQYFGAGRLNAARAVRAEGGGGGPGPTAVPTSLYPTATPVPGGDYAARLEQLINDYRRENGLPALRHDARLARAAQAHNLWMDTHNCFAHECPGEPGVAQRMRDAGYPLVTGGENIGRGYQDPAAMLAGWKGSAGHRAALLNTYWPDIGCHFHNGGGGHYLGMWWSCEFARGLEGPPPPLPPAPTLTPTATPRPAPTATRPPSETLWTGQFFVDRWASPAAESALRAYCARWQAAGVTCSPRPSGSYWLYGFIPPHRDDGRLDDLYRNYCLPWQARGVRCYFWQARP